MFACYDYAQSAVPYDEEEQCAEVARHRQRKEAHEAEDGKRLPAAVERDLERRPPDRQVGQLDHGNDINGGEEVAIEGAAVLGGAE